MGKIVEELKSKTNRWQRRTTGGRAVDAAQFSSGILLE